MPEKIRARATQLVALIADADAELLAETMTAFANADGGTIYVGVDVQGAPTGAVIPEEFNEVVPQAELLCRPPIPVYWEQSEVGGRFIFVGRVQRGMGLHTLANGRVLMRTGAHNRVLSGRQVQQLATTRITAEYEAEIVPGASRDDFDETILTAFVEAWQKRQGRLLTRPLDDLLIEFGWLTVSRQPTVAGILLFSAKPQVYLPRSGLTFVRFDGQQVQRASEGAVYGRREEINGPLPAIIAATWDLITREIRVGAVVKELERKEQWQYPPTAIREALVNAVAHRDYQVRGRGIEVRMFSDRLEIYSPGGLPGFITLDNIVDEHYSRNPLIVNGLYQWGYIEELGLGINLMIDEMVQAGHPPPHFRSNEHSFTVIFQNEQNHPPVIRINMNMTMNERQAKALAFIQQNGRITNRDYQKLCPDVSPETLRLDMVDMVERNVLLKIGRKRGTYYILK